MVALADAVFVLYPTAVPLTDYIVADDGTGAAITYWDTAKLGPPPTPEALAGVTEAQVTEARHETERDQGVAVVDDPRAGGKTIRAVVVLTVDEINDLRNWIAAFKTATAASSTLADFKNRVAALQNLPLRNYTQARNAVKTHISAGNVDT